MICSFDLKADIWYQLPEMTSITLARVQCADEPYQRALCGLTNTEFDKVANAILLGLGTADGAWYYAVRGSQIGILMADDRKKGATLTVIGLPPGARWTQTEAVAR